MIDLFQIEPIQTSNKATARSKTFDQSTKIEFIKRSNSTETERILDELKIEDHGAASRAENRRIGKNKSKLIELTLLSC